jgi:hypothetical protein
MDRLRARLDGWRVEILRGDEVVGGGDWNGHGIENCTVEMSPEQHEQWVADIEADVDAALAAAPPAFDENGCDLQLIDWMLSMTPAQRLQTVQSWIDTFGPAIGKVG